jgi:galactokinase
VSIAVRYPGRACLLGEHCDWAGGASLAVPLAEGVRVVAEPAARDLRVRSALEGRLLEGRWPVEGAVERDGGTLRFVPAAAAALHANGIHPPPSLLWVDSDLLPGRGFSSSAAFCLAVLDALARHAGVALEPTRLAALATHVERDLLGVPCGRLDPLACVAGAPVLLRWGPDGDAPLERVRPGAPLHLVIGAFAAHRDTPAILRALHEHFHADLREPRDREAVTAVRAAIATFGSATESGAAALQAGDLGRLGQEMDRCQEAYEAAEAVVPQLSAPGLRRAVAGLRSHGALGAKFSGAGGDGSVIALYESQADAREARAWLGDQPGMRAWTRTLEDV